MHDGGVSGAESVPGWMVTRQMPRQIHAVMQHPEHVNHAVFAWSEHDEVTPLSTASCNVQGVNAGA